MTQVGTAAKARRAFSPKTVARAFKATFDADNRNAKIVLAWIADRTHATSSVLRGTPEDTHAAAAQRELWLDINDILRLSEQDIRDLQEQVAEWS